MDKYVQIDLCVLVCVHVSAYIVYFYIIDVIECNIALLLFFILIIKFHARTL